jgi:hypothetical protein
MQIDRREFNQLCAALNLALSTMSAVNAMLPNVTALAAGAGAASTGPAATVKFRDGTIVPALGQGSWHLAQGRHPEPVEEEALRTGLSLGLTLIDTAELYGNGRAEEFIGRVIAGRRDRVFLVSKVLPSHVAGNRAAALTTSISICCIGEIPTLTSPSEWRRSKICAKRARSTPGGCPTSRSATWKIFSVCQTAIDAPLIRSATVSIVAALRMICCPGASNAVCR